MATKYNTISLKMPVNLNKILKKIAKEEDRSKSSIMRKALQNYLEDYRDLKIAEKTYQEYMKNGEQSFTLKEIREMHDV